MVIYSALVDSLKIEQNDPNNTATNHRTGREMEW